MEVRVTVKEMAERAEEMEVVGLAVVVMAGAVRGEGVMVVVGLAVGVRVVGSGVEARAADWEETVTAAVVMVDVVIWEVVKEVAGLVAVVRVEDWVAAGREAERVEAERVDVEWVEEAMVAVGKVFEVRVVVGSATAAMAGGLVARARAVEVMVGVEKMVEETAA